MGVVIPIFLCLRHASSYALRATGGRSPNARVPFRHASPRHLQIIFCGNVTIIIDASIGKVKEKLSFLLCRIEMGLV